MFAKVFVGLGAISGGFDLDCLLVNNLVNVVTELGALELELLEGAGNLVVDNYTGSLY